MRKLHHRYIAIACLSIVLQMGGHGVFVGSGGGMPQPRGMHQPGMHPMNPSQGLRAQVPHQFLSAQVCCLLSLMLLFMMNVVFRRDGGSPESCQFC